MDEKKRRSLQGAYSQMIEIKEKKEKAERRLITAWLVAVDPDLKANRLAH
jgi:hypothetical protein